MIIICDGYTWRCRFKIVLEPFWDNLRIVGRMLGDHHGTIQASFLAVGAEDGPKLSIIILAYYKRCLLLQEMPPTTRDAPYYKRCLLLQEMPPTTRDASYYNTCIRLQDLHPTTRLASYYEPCILLQDLHPIARQASNRHKTCTRLQNLPPTTIRLASDYKTSIQPP